MKTAQVEPIHAEYRPVRAYADWISGVNGENHVVVTVVSDSAAYEMGYRYVSIPATELDYYLEQGASLAV